mgnify:FL=1
MKGKPQKIDILKLYANGDTKAWNTFLSGCLQNYDLLALEKVLYGIELGMQDLAKQKMNSDKINAWFLRLQRSIEKTIRDIIRSKNPHPLDDPFNKEKFGHMIDSKKKRDEDIERHLKKIRF